MISFQDKTFCTDEFCKHFDKCNKAYNKKAKVENIDNMLIAIYTDKLECYEASSIQIRLNGELDDDWAVL